MIDLDFGTILILIIIFVITVGLIMYYKEKSVLKQEHLQEDLNNVVNISENMENMENID